MKTGRKHEIGAPGKTVLGLTGPIASGKSLALSLFIKEGALGISADELASALLTEPACYNRISRKFGPDKILTNGLLDKKKLAAEVFGSPAKRKWLEGLLHPEILKRIHFLITRSKKKIAVVEVPLLFEAGLGKCFSYTISMAAPAKTLEARALKRGWSAGQYRGREKSQLSAEEKYALSDMVLENSGTVRELAEKVRFICRFLKETAKEEK